MLIDSHVHLITHRMAQLTADAFMRRYPSAFERAFKKGGALLSPTFMQWLKPLTVERLAAMWLDEMDRYKVDHACFLPIFGGSHGQLEEFLSLAPDRFSGYLFLSEPHTKKALQEVRSWKKKNRRFIGVKLYPSLSHISMADERLFPLYETLGELGMSALIHCGITTAPVPDYRYTNPLDLQLPSRLFPDTTFIVAHFGAGFFREILMLGYHANNVYVDTSGTNNWREYLPEVTPLSDIFRRTVDVFGAERVLFGTDSMLRADAGYRGHIVAEQKKAMSSAKLTKKEKAAIFHANAEKLFAIGQG